mmetsp:Transcript_798/g.1674  ORF Transcript_798/g.1674 Transcript_798/m.1674 type:complete len:226 (+) Transcript_798:598-1275(+)
MVCMELTSLAVMLLVASGLSIRGGRSGSISPFAVICSKSFPLSTRLISSRLSSSVSSSLFLPKTRYIMRVSTQAPAMAIPVQAPGLRPPSVRVLPLGVPGPVMMPGISTTGEAVGAFVGSGVGLFLSFFVGSSVGTIDGQMLTLGRIDGGALLVGAMLVVGRAVVGSSPVGGSLLSPILFEVTEQMSRKYSCICVLKVEGSSIPETSSLARFPWQQFPLPPREWH